MKKVVGTVILLLICGALGYVGYLYLAPFSVSVDSWVNRTFGWLFILELFALVIVDLMLVMLLSRITVGFGIGGSKLFSALSALLTGAPLTWDCIENFSLQLYSSGWSGAFYVLFGGIGFMAAAYMGTYFKKWEA